MFIMLMLIYAQYHINNMAPVTIRHTQRLCSYILVVIPVCFVIIIIIFSVTGVGGIIAIGPEIARQTLQI